MGWVGSVIWLVGLGWVDENRPTDNSAGHNKPNEGKIRTNTIPPGLCSGNILTTDMCHQRRLSSQSTWQVLTNKPKQLYEHIVDYNSTKRNPTKRRYTINTRKKV